MRYGPAILILIVLIALIALSSMAYIVPEGHQAVITEFGKPVRAVREAGLYWKKPFIQQVIQLEKRLMPWDGDPQDMPTKDKRRIGIDVWARWRISDPMTFYQVVGTETAGQQRLDEMVDSAVRQVIAANNLIEAVRSTNETLEYESEELEKEWSERREQVQTGRIAMEKEILARASERLEETFGMQLTEVHIKRINYVPSVRDKVYDRMRSERMRIAALYESEAEEEKNRILGLTRKELDEIEGEMQQRSAEIRGAAEAAVIAITAEAYGKDPEFYAFLRQLEAYEKTLGDGSRLILSTDNDFLRRISRFDQPPQALAAQ